MQSKMGRSNKNIVDKRRMGGQARANCILVEVYPYRYAYAAKIHNRMMRQKSTTGACESEKACGVRVACVTMLSASSRADGRRDTIEAAQVAAVG